MNIQGFKLNCYYILLFFFVLFGCWAIRAEGACLAPPEGVEALWSGDGTAKDLIGGNNGSLYNGASFSAGKVQQAFSFDGLDDYVGVPAKQWGFSTTATVTAWIKTTDSYPGSILSLGHGDRQDEMLLYIDSSGRAQRDGCQRRELAFGCRRDGRLRTMRGPSCLRRWCRRAGGLRRGDCARHY